MFKQALKSGGGHLTVKHIEEVSLGALFLLQAARETDRAFKVKPPSTSHTVRDSNSDVMKMTTHLLEKEVHLIKSERRFPVFIDPTDSGWKKISTTTWLKDTLSRSHSVDFESAENLQQEQEVDLYYELADASIV